MSRLLPLVLLLGAGIAAAQEPGHVRHPLLAAQPASEADGALLLVEIPAGSAVILSENGLDAAEFKPEVERIRVDQIRHPAMAAG